MRPLPILIVILLSLLGSVILWATLEGEPPKAFVRAAMLDGPLTVFVLAFVFVVGLAILAKLDGIHAELKRLDDIHAELKKQNKLLG
jgi:hypothetical protein